MKNILAAMLGVCGVAMLVTGYSAQRRADHEINIIREARFKTATFLAQLDTTNQVATAEVEYKRKMAQIAAGNYNPEPPSTPHEEQPGPQLKPMFNELNGNMEDWITKNTYSVNGTVQYCTGWLLLAAACIVFESGGKKKDI